MIDHSLILVLFAECYDVISLVLEVHQGQLPTPGLVMQHWPSVAAHWGGKAQQMFLQRGGSVELALGHLVDSCSHLEVDDYFDITMDEDEEDEGCSNDCNYTGVFEALVGGVVPRKMRGCADCGMYESDGESLDLDDDDDM